MIVNDYKNLIANDKHYDVFVNIYDVFHKFMEIQDDVKKSIDYLISENIINILKKLWNFFIKNKVKYINSSISSLFKNVQSLIKSQTNTDSTIKRRKVILSYINFELSSVSYEKINEVINMTQEERKKENKKVILVIGGTNLNDNINVSKEIEEIRKIFYSKGNYYVISVIGCTIDVFRSFIKNYSFDYFHFAGHGTSEGNICLYGSNAKPSTIEKIFNTHSRMVECCFFNNCYSSTFYCSISIKFSNYYIVYDGLLNSKLAFDFSENYYNCLSNTNSAKGSYVSTQSNFNNPNYILFH